MDGALEQGMAAAPPPTEGAAGFAQGVPDPQFMELFDRAVDYTREMLAQGSEEILAAMKLDVVGAAVKFGVRALRAVAVAAEEAGSPLPPEVVIAAGVQTLKDLGAAAEANGLLSEDQDEVFMKEAAQQAFNEFAKLDREAGRISDEDMQQLFAAGGATAQGMAQGQPQ